MFCTRMFKLGFGTFLSVVFVMQIHYKSRGGDTYSNLPLNSIMTLSWNVGMQKENRNKSTSKQLSLWTEIQDVKGDNTKQQVEQQTNVNSKSLKQTAFWIVLMTVNSAFLDFYQNWLWHYQQLYLPADIPIVVIAEDDELYKNVETLNTEGVTVKKSHLEPITGSLVFDTPLFKAYMSRRAIYIQEHLQKGFDVLHVDVDSVWLKNPFPYLVGDFDIWGQVDKPADFVCIGFLALKSNDKVKSFVKSWIDAMQVKTNTKADQDVFNDVLRPEMQLRLKKLPTDEFPSGKLYFDNFDNVTRARTVVVHNNWVIGHDTKKNRFIKFNLWKV